MGNRVTDRIELREMATNYFKDLYSDDGQANAPSYPFTGAFPKLDFNRIEGIDATISSEEIKENIFSMGALKAPGPDEFHAKFFQSHWDIVGESVCNFIKSCFQDPSNIDSINDTDVVLIPKIDNPDTIKQFKPISLCNVI